MSSAFDHWGQWSFHGRKSATVFLTCFHSFSRFSIFDTFATLEARNVAEVQNLQCRSSCHSTLLRNAIQFGIFFIFEYISFLFSSEPLSFVSEVFSSLPRCLLWERIMLPAPAWGLRFEICISRVEACIIRTSKRMNKILIPWMSEEVRKKNRSNIQKKYSKEIKFSRNIWEIFVKNCCFKSLLHCSHTEAWLERQKEYGKEGGLWRDPDCRLEVSSRMWKLLPWVVAGVTFRCSDTVVAILSDCCGTVALWHCGIVALWQSGTLASCGMGWVNQKVARCLLISN